MDGAPEISFLSSPSLSPDWETARNLKQLEEATAQKGMEGPRGAGGPGSSPASATDCCGMRGKVWAPVSSQDLRVSLCPAGV